MGKIEHLHWCEKNYRLLTEIKKTGSWMDWLMDEWREVKAYSVEKI